MSRAGRSWSARHGGALLLVAPGAGLLISSVAQGSSNPPFSIALLVFGCSMVVLGVVLPRLRNAEVRPAVGFKLTLAEERTVSTGLAEAEHVGVVEVSQIVSATRLVLASEVLARLLAPDAGPLGGALFHLYLFDAQRELLLPAFEGQPSPARGWKPGTGAVGDAWESGEYVLVRGPEVCDDTYGLSPSQQRRARDLAMVAAMPVTNASDDVVAVLAGSSVDPWSGLATEEGFDAHLLVAQEVARVLVDLLRWFSD